jgi:hypothetical protein
MDNNNIPDGFVSDGLDNAGADGLYDPPQKQRLKML